MVFESESRFDVRYAETDQMGVVYYANYLVWMEIGRTDFCKAAGFNYHDLERECEAFVAVAEANCRYVSSARYGDSILVRTRLEKINRRLLQFAYSIFSERDQKLLAEGTTVHVIVGRDGRPKALPSPYLELLTQRCDG